MSESISALPNSKEKLQERLKIRAHHLEMADDHRICSLGPRHTCASIGCRSLYAQRPSNPLASGSPWWIVYGTLIDIGCFVLLARLAQREGIRLLDLISFQRQRLGKDLLIGVGFIPLFIILVVAGGITTGLLIYGATPAPATMVPLPLWGTLYSLIVWPIIWAFAKR